MRTSESDECLFRTGNAALCGIGPAKKDGMNTRIKPHAQGDLVKVRSLPQYPLPMGLGECQEVVIREIREGIRVVSDQGGTLHELPVVCVVSALEYRLAEEWVPPSHPTVARRLATGQ